MRQTIQRLRRGFTLLEILVTVVIISVGIVAVTRAFNKGLEAYNDIENVDLALNIARARMETVKISAFDDLEDMPAASDSNFPDFTVAAEVSDKTEHLKEVKVIVAWAAPGGSANVSLTTFVAD